jgi:hypothetical protein
MPKIPSKAELLQLITNPLIREVFSKNAENASHSEEKAKIFTAGAKDMNEFLSRGSVETTKLMTQIKSRSTPSRGAITADDLNKKVELSEDEKNLAKKIDFIQTYINGKQTINETLIAREIERIPPIDIGRVEFAVDNLKTKLSPQALIDKVTRAIENSFSEEMLFKLQTFRDYTKIENQAAKDTGTPQPFSIKLITALDNQIEKTMKLRELHKDVKAFESRINLHEERTPSITESSGVAEEVKQNQSSTFQFRK